MDKERTEYAVLTHKDAHGCCEYVGCSKFLALIVAIECIIFERSWAKEIVGKYEVKFIVNPNKNFN